MTIENREPPSAFQLVEATIDELHAPIRSGQTTCAAAVQEYIARARAYNGVASRLVTAVRLHKGISAPHRPN